MEAKQRANLADIFESFVRNLSRVQRQYFKIVELVTYTRAKKKPELDVILRESKTLKITALDESEMREFYKVRGRDAAHDWDKVRGVTRRKAIECKMWAEELIIRDMLDRARSSRPAETFVVHNSPQGAIVTPKFTNSKPNK